MKLVHVDESDPKWQTLTFTDKEGRVIRLFVANDNDVMKFDFDPMQSVWTRTNEKGMYIKVN